MRPINSLPLLPLEVRRTSLVSVGCPSHAWSWTMKLEGVTSALYGTATLLIMAVGIWVHREMTPIEKMKLLSP